ncbi:MAG: hypothetical protein ACI4SG_05950 [Oligosphaeraceae bacterium]
MPGNKKQLVCLVRLVAQLKEDRNPNCSSFVADVRRADMEEDLNLSFTPKTIAYEIQVLKQGFNAPVDFNRAGTAIISSTEWTFTFPQIFEDSCMLPSVLGARVAECIFPPEESIFAPGVICYVKVHCDAHMSKNIQVHLLHLEHQVQRHMDDSCELFVVKMSKNHLSHEIMAQCGRAEILSPEGIGSEIFRWPQKIMETYHGL